MDGIAKAMKTQLSPPANRAVVTWEGPGKPRAHAIRPGRRSGGGVTVAEAGAYLGAGAVDAWRPGDQGGPGGPVGTRMSGAHLGPARARSKARVHPAARLRGLCPLSCGFRLRLKWGGGVSLTAFPGPGPTLANLRLSGRFHPASMITVQIEFQLIQINRYG